MNKRIAKKVLNQDGFHWQWYARNGIISLAPIHSELYFKACARLHQKPYYDKQWLANIQKWRKERKVTISAGKSYIRPRIKTETVLGKDELLAMNPHWVETSYGSWWQIDPTIPAGDVDLQIKLEQKDKKGDHQEWPDLW